MTDSATTTNLNIPFPEPRNAQELVNLVQTTITQIQDRFGQMSDSIMSRIDDCGQRIDTLERNVAHVISQRNAQ